MNQSISDSQDFYDEFFADSNHLIYHNRQRYEIVFSLIDDVGLPSTARVLDIGAGGGRITEFLHERFDDVTAIDITATPLMQETLSETNAHFSVAALPYLPFRDEVFDLVVCSEVLEHIPRRPTQLSSVEAIARVLAVDGWLVLSTPNPKSPYKRLKDGILYVADATPLYERSGGQLVENWIPPKQLRETIELYFDIFDARGSYYNIPGFRTGLQSKLRPLSDVLTEWNVAPQLGLYQYYLGRKSD